MRYSSSIDQFQLFVSCEIIKNLKCQKSVFSNVLQQVTYQYNLELYEITNVDSAFEFVVSAGLNLESLHNFAR